MKGRLITSRNKTNEVYLTVYLRKRQINKRDKMDLFIWLY